MRSAHYRFLALLAALTALFLVPIFRWVAHAIPGIAASYDAHHTVFDTVLAGLAALCGSLATYVLLRRAQAPLERFERGLGNLQSPITPVGDPHIDQAIEQINTLMALEKQMHVLQEQERIRIARDLHDHVLQDLLGARMALARGEQQPGLQALQEAIASLREGIQNLAPPEIELLGLETALEDRAASLGLQLSAQGLQEVPEKERLEMYRLVEHAMLNAHRHGQASHITVVYQPGKLCVQDNGKGLPEGFSLGLGLTLCQTQMRLRGGGLSLSPLPRGTELMLWWK